MSIYKLSKTIKTVPFAQTLLHSHGPILHANKNSFNTSAATYIKKILPFINIKQVPTITVLRFDGAIASGNGLRRINLFRFETQIKKCFDTRNLKAVCLQINSPGGSPVQSHVLMERIRMFADTKNIPVYAFIEDVGASGGYLLACAADEIYAHESSIVGSIGVVKFSFGLQDVISKLGIERRVQTAGKMKVVDDPFATQSEEGIARSQRILQALHINFIEAVKASRKDRLKKNEDELFNGDVWTGKAAVEVGLIDGIDSFDSFLTTKFGSKVKIIRPKQKTSALTSLFKGDFSALVDTIVDSFETRLYEDFWRQRLF